MNVKNALLRHYPSFMSAVAIEYQIIIHLPHHTREQIRVALDIIHALP